MCPPNQWSNDGNCTPQTDKNAKPQQYQLGKLGTKRSIKYWISQQATQSLRKEIAPQNIGDLGQVNNQEVCTSQIA